MVMVADTGSGIPPAVLERVFEPFFTTKDVGKGSGLGLAQVYGFAKQSGGGVRIETEMGAGTRVMVYLPRASQAPAQELDAAGEDDRLTSDGVNAVLLVDDDDAVRETTAAMLEELGYNVAEAASGQAALEALDGVNRFDLMVVDFAMPGMNGAETAAEAQRRFPELPVIFVTGYAETSALTEVGAVDGRILQKPFRSIDLASKVRNVLDATKPRTR